MVETWGSWAQRATDPERAANCKPTPWHVRGRSGREGLQAEIGAVLVIFLIGEFTSSTASAVPWFERGGDDQYTIRVLREHTWERQKEGKTTCNNSISLNPWIIYDERTELYQVQTLQRSDWFPEGGQGDFKDSTQSVPCHHRTHGVGPGQPASQGLFVFLEDK